MYEEINLKIVKFVIMMLEPTSTPITHRSFPGCCGLASDTDVHVPTRVNMTEVALGQGHNAEIARVAVGGYCSAAVSTSGDLYMWGNAGNHQVLDLPVPINTAKPRFVTKLAVAPRRIPPPTTDGKTSSRLRPHLPPPRPARVCA